MTQELEKMRLCLDEMLFLVEIGFKGIIVLEYDAISCSGAGGVRSYTKMGCREELW